MKTIEYHDTIDKRGWSEGPWMKEPDKIQWKDEETGLPCLIVRNSMGSLCGYVGVTAGHPLMGSEGDGLSVHGGITFTGFCQEGGEEGSRICHRVEDGEDDHVFWFGFDTAHSGDYIPNTWPRVSPHEWETYRDLSYVRREVLQLAQQIAALAT